MCVEFSVVDLKSQELDVLIRLKSSARIKRRSFSRPDSYVLREKVQRRQFLPSWIPFHTKSQRSLSIGVDLARGGAAAASGGRGSYGFGAASVLAALQ